MLGKLRIGIPAFGRRVFFSSAVQMMSSRLTVAGDTLPGLALQDITLSTLHPVIGGFGIEAGVRNLWNTQYDDPVGLSVDTMRQDGAYGLGQARLAGTPLAVRSVPSGKPGLLTSNQRPRRF